MKRYIIALVGLFFLCAAASARTTLDSLYRELDQAIARSDEYVAQRQQRIGQLKLQLEGVQSRRDRYRLNMSLFHEYEAFKSDSAFAYIDACIDIAAEQGNAARVAEAKARKAYLAASVGMYAESRDLLSEIDVETADTLALGRYYLAQHHLYGELAYYSTLEEKKQEFFRKQDAFQPLVYAYLSPESDELLQCREMEAYAKNDISQALAINDMRLAQVTPESRDFAIVAFYRYLDLNRRGDLEEGLEWLVSAAISDVQHGVYDQGALWELASLIMLRDEVERSHIYINHAWACAREFGTRVRSWQITPVLRNIDANYHEQLISGNRMIKFALVVVSLMLLWMIGLLYYANKQRKRVADMRDQLALTNEKEKQLNRKLQDSLLEVEQTNLKLSNAINQLRDAGRVKEEYIGHFLTMYSDYIDRMDKFRNMVHRRVKNHEYEQLMKETRVRDTKDQDIDALHKHFDTAFLNLFPNFIEDFNALLRPEDQITPSEDGRLSTSLRIFALIRLGIEDSSKIAEFLHYSVNTIYNYRARVKNGALSDRDHFEERVKEIGLLR